MTLVSKWTIVHDGDPYEDVKEGLDIVRIGVAHGDGTVNKNAGKGSRLQIDCAVIAADLAKAVSS
jgi:hypothetical protein